MTASPQPPGQAGAGTRREFLRACVRYPLAGALAALGVVLGLRDGHPSAADCPQDRPCRHCGRWSACGLPPAVAAHEAAKSP